MEFENCWDSDWNYYTGPFVDILTRIGFKIPVNMDQIAFLEEASNMPHVYLKDRLNALG